MEKRFQEILQEVINQPYSLPPQFFELIAGECRIEQVQKKQKLSEIGQANNSEYFLLEGVIHRYTLVEKGEFITTGFYVGPTILTPHFARTSGGRSIFSLQALTEVTVAEISATVLDELINTYNEIRRWEQKIIERKLKLNFVNEIRFRGNSAKERLIHLRDEFPNLENLVPHTCIASYVGITPVSFSRLRKELTHPS
ncbi:MAG TPA: Crp/Fnr family transcriptional regulator [Balneolaceae bacterium]|nr:Crp/Fnr family transcriptional regulator [Balneolaceae bacterium]